MMIQGCALYPGITTGPRRIVASQTKPELDGAWHNISCFVGGRRATGGTARYGACSGPIWTVESTRRLFRIDLRQPTATPARRRPILPAATASVLSVWPRQSAIAAAAGPNEPAAIEPPRLRQRTDAAAAAAGRSSRATTSARSGAARGGRRSWTNADRLAAGPGVAA